MNLYICIVRRRAGYEIVQPTSTSLDSPRRIVESNEGLYYRFFIVAAGERENCFLPFNIQRPHPKLFRSISGLQTLQSHEFILIPKFVTFLIADKEQLSAAQHFFHSNSYRTSITKSAILVSLTVPLYGHNDLICRKRPGCQIAELCHLLNCFV